MTLNEDLPITILGEANGFTMLLGERTGNALNLASLPLNSHPTVT
jgi:hypothetical protein